MVNPKEKQQVLAWNKPESLAESVARKYLPTIKW